MTVPGMPSAKRFRTACTTWHTKRGVNVGRDHETPAFAMASICKWWSMIGHRTYPAATDLYITSNWNNIEHRLFCHLIENWRRRALLTFKTLIDLIGHTETSAKLRVEGESR
jgi:hypothetical protein